MNLLRQNSACITFLVASSCFVSTGAFSVIDPTTVIPALHEASTTLSSAIPVPTSPLPTNEATNILSIYKQALATNPLPAKMATGATLALMGDAIAQSKDDAEYDTPRALSFMGFDACYRALQHVSFPIIVTQCQGQYIGGLLSTLPFMTQVSSETSGYFAAMEQTLASQLGIVPFIYYPVFYTFTALVQGITAGEAVQRAKDTFVPLMKRNLLFWIPVQFVQFGFVDESLQIPFLSVCGLVWTFILSMFAGDAKKGVSGNEEECDVGEVGVGLIPVDDYDDMKELNERILSVVEKEKQVEKEREREVSMR